MALGLFVIPARKRAAKREMNERLGALRGQLTESLSSQFSKELRGSFQRITAAIAPYTRFVRAERAKLAETRDQLAAAQQAQGRLRVEIEEALNS